MDLSPNLFGGVGSNPTGCNLTDWRNGSASDSSPEGYVFESRIGHASKHLTRSPPPQPDGGEDLFCHVSAIMDGNALREGDTVQFVRAQRLSRNALVA